MEQNHLTSGRVPQRGPSGTGPAVHEVMGGLVRMKGSILLIAGDSFENTFARWGVAVTAAVGRFGWLPLVVGARRTFRSKNRGEVSCQRLSMGSAAVYWATVWN